MMKQTRLPTKQEIEELIAFLPKLYAEGFTPFMSWNGGQKEGNTFTLPYPSYDPTVEEFYRLAAADYWMDYEYEPETAGKCYGMKLLSNPPAWDKSKAC
ncbi:MAG: DUF6508 domain-containing protein [Anaerolineales bacterium]